MRPSKASHGGRALPPLRPLPMTCTVYAGNKVRQRRNDMDDRRCCHR